jgi:putative transposase
MITFIDDHRAAYGVEPICRVLPIAPSTYHAHAAKRADPSKRSARERRDMALQADIKRVWDANFQVYGVRKVWRQLQREAIEAPRCQVARLMKRMGLAGAVRGRTVKTTHSDKSAPCPLDRVNRQIDQLYPIPRGSARQIGAGMLALRAPLECPGKNQMAKSRPRSLIHPLIPFPREIRQTGRC